LDAHYAREEEHWFGVLVDNDLTDGDTLPRDKKQELVKAGWAEIGEEPWLTPTEQIKTSREVFDHLEKQGVEEPLFQAYSKYQRASKFRTTYLEPVFDAGEEPIMCSFDTPKNTGRLGSRAPNTQNLPARLNGEERERLKKDPNAVVGPDIRGCFVPREGHSFIACDYVAMELTCLSEYIAVWLGEVKKMGRAINEGKDLHSLAASAGLRISYPEAMFRKALSKGGLAWEEAVEMVCEEYGADESDISRWATDGQSAYMNVAAAFARWREIYKVANFSFPVGAAPKTFAKQVRARGEDFTDAEGEYVHEQWFQAWPEMLEYRDLIASFATGMDSYVLPHLGPYGAKRGWRVSGPSKASQAGNYAFQGLGADCIKLAGYKITREMFEMPDSPLYGSHLVLCIHDELVCETPAAKAKAAAQRLSEAMDEWASVFLQHVHPASEAEIMYERLRK